MDDWDDWMEQQQLLDERRYRQEQIEEAAGLEIDLTARGYASIKSVDIFAVGTWRGTGAADGGDTYSHDDLEEMVRAFRAGVVAPKLKITHGTDEEQVDVGQVRNLQVRNGKLFGDFVSIPMALYALMKRGLFRARSAEILWNLRDHAGRMWKRVLKAVALLAPGQRPAVTSLSEGYQFQKAYYYMVCQPHYNQKEGSTMKRGIHPITDGILHDEEHDRQYFRQRRNMGEASAELHRLTKVELARMRGVNPTASYGDALAVVRETNPALAAKAATGKG